MTGERSQSDQKVGAIFPILRKHVLNLFSQNCDVFAKFTWMTLKNGSTIVFYVSGEGLLTGEAKVSRIEKMNPNAAWSHYKNRIFLDEEEYSTYARISPVSKWKRMMTEITVFELENIKKYKRPVRSTYTVTPSGRYLTKEMIKKIRSLTLY